MYGKSAPNDGGNVDDEGRDNGGPVRPNIVRKAPTVRRPGKRRGPVSSRMRCRGGLATRLKYLMHSKISMASSGQLRE
jgi:hypothetical protein